MKISEEEQTRRRDRIIHEAFNLFCKKGIAKVTMEAIADASGVGVMSVYRYFNSKSELLAKTQLVLWREVREEFEKSMGVGTREYAMKTGYEQVAVFLQGFSYLYQEHGEYILFAADYKLYLAWEGLTRLEKDEFEMLNPTMKVFYNAIEKGRRDGSLKIEGDLDDVFYTMWGILRGFTEEVVVYDRVLDGKNNWKIRFRFVEEMMLERLSGRNGDKLFRRPRCSG